MRRNILPSTLLVVLGLLVAPALVSCNDDDDTGTTVQPATIELLLLQKIDDVPGFSAAMGKLVLHVMGMPQQGVNVTDTGTGYTGSVEVDKDGDGFPEGVVAGTLTFNDPNQGISGGATLHLTELTGNIIDLMCTVEVNGSVVTFDDIVANVPVEGMRPEVEVSSGQVIVDGSLSPPGITGTVEFVVGDLAATMTLSNDGSGNPSAFVSGSGFSFTVP